MLCCCPKEKSTTYTVGEEGEKQAPKEGSPPKSGGDPPLSASIQTGKGALSSSNQNIPAEAQLDKSTVSATKKEKSPVTEQPTSALVQAATQKAAVVEDTVKAEAQSASNNAKPKESEETTPQSQSFLSGVVESAKPIALSQIESQISSKESVLTEAKSAVSSNLGELKSKASNIDLLKPIVSGLDKLEHSIGEAEERPAREAKQAIPGLASQLKVLNSQVLSAAKGPAKMSDNLQQVVSRLEAVASRLEGLALSGGKGAAAGDADAVAPSVSAYDADIISASLAKFISLSNDIGGDVKTQAAIVKQAFDAQRSFLVVASKSKQPDQSVLQQLLKPMATKLGETQEFRENNRRSDFFNHLSAISESVAALGWVTISPTPGPYVKEMTDAGTFYSNRVLKDFKEKDPRHVEWTRSWISTLTNLQAFIKEYHTTGLTWNPNGGDAKASAGASAPPPPPAGGAPPPPPPPPPGP
ncbi:adenylyl cyclase-associated protein 2, partial [Aplysia californica]|uniref:Adenylyl cyclase-associated protein 2 n=1 Tax=Aplysia californica TaxID=6500 RepID=A0ABM0K885_APLCA